MSEISKFLKEVIARVKGDDVEVMALKNERKAKSAIQGQIHSLESKLVDDEICLDEAKQRHEDAIYPTSLISDATNYCSNLIRTKEGVDKAEKSLKQTKDTLEFLKDLLKTKF